MDMFKFALALGALVALALSYRVPRAPLWIGGLAAAFVISALYAGAGLPHTHVFNLLVDTCLCLAIHRVASEEYEAVLYNLLRFSVLVSSVEYASILIFKVEHHLVYVVILEIINWLALAAISSEGIKQWAGGNGNHLPHRHGFDLPGARHYLRRSGRENSWLNK